MKTRVSPTKPEVVFVWNIVTSSLGAVELREKATVRLVGKTEVNFRGP